MPCKMRVFSSHTKASSHSKKKVNKFTHVSVKVHISSDTAKITDNELDITSPYGSSDTDSATCCCCGTITDFAGRAEHPKFMPDSIRTGVLHVDNMYFRLFSELIDSLSSKTFRYSHETMMWWKRDTKCLVVGDSDLWQLQMLMEGSHLLIPSKPRCATSSQDLFQTQVQKSSTKVRYASLIL